MSWPPLPPWSEVVDAAQRITLPTVGLALAVPLTARWAFGRAVAAAIPAGAAAGLATAFALRNVVPWQPEDFGSGWIHVAWAAALAGGGLAALLPSRWNWAPKLATVAVAAYVAVPTERRDSPWWFVALAAAMALPWLASPTPVGVVTKRPWPERSLWLAIALAAMSVVALYAHYLRVTDFAMMAFCALAGGVVACALLGRDGRELEGLGYVTLPAMALWLWNDVESAIPEAAFACAGLAAVPLAASCCLPREGLRAALLRGASAVLPAMIAVVLAMIYEEASFG